MIRRRFGKIFVDVETIYERDGGRCHICQRRLSITDVVLDHIVPVSRLTSDNSYLASDPNNARIAHHRCNGKRRNSGFGQMPLALIPTTKVLGYDRSAGGMSIRLPRDVYRRLEARKIISQEPFSSVIKRLLDAAEKEEEKGKSL